MKTVTINIYSFDELSKEAKQRAINEHLDFLDGQMEEYEDGNGEMQSHYVDHTEQDAIESIQANEYMYFADGDMAHITQFVEKHPRAGQTEFYFHGETITI